MSGDKTKSDQTPEPTLPSARARIPPRPRLHLQLLHPVSRRSTSHTLVVGDSQRFEAQVLETPDNVLQVWLLYKLSSERYWRRAPMRSQAPGSWQCTLKFNTGGSVGYLVEAWVDVFATWEMTREKLHTGADKEHWAKEGARLLKATSEKLQGFDRTLFLESAMKLEGSAPRASASKAVLSRETKKRMRIHGPKSHLTKSPETYALQVERKRARLGLWTRAPVAKLAELARQGYDFVALEDVDFFGHRVESKVAEGIRCEAAMEVPLGDFAKWGWQESRWSAWAAETNTMPKNTGGLPFWGEDYPKLWRALVERFRSWSQAGIRAFRVLEPQAAPLAMWQYVLSRLKQQFPDTVFVAAGGVPPAWQTALWTVGFTLIERQLRAGQPTWTPERRWLSLAARPHSPAHWVTTALLSPACFLPWQTAPAAWPARLSALRQSNLALQYGDNAEMASSNQPAFAAFVKRAGNNQLLIVVNQSSETREGEVALSGAVATAWGRTYQLQDLLSGLRVTWHGERGFVRLTPERLCHVFRRRVVTGGLKNLVEA